MNLCLYLLTHTFIYIISLYIFIFISLSLSLSCRSTHNIFFSVYPCTLTYRVSYIYMLHTMFSFIPVPSFSLTLSSPLNTFLLAVTLLVLALAFFLYIFQAKLIYIPQLPPGSQSEVWLPSRFGYGPGIIKFVRKKCSGGGEHGHCSHEHKITDTETNDSAVAWEELELITPDNVKLQAYWLKAPSKLKDSVNRGDSEESSIKRRMASDSDPSNVPYTILYMQANAGNIVIIIIIII